MKNIFDFNHIDNNVNEENLSEIKALYRFYHKQFWCHKKAHKHFKRINSIFHLSCCDWYDTRWNNSDANTIGNNFRLLLKHFLK